MKKILLSVLTIYLAGTSLWAQPAPAPAQNEPARPDWADLAHYAAANRQLPAPVAGTPRVVLIGSSTTEFWLRDDAPFFANASYAYINRGISGQTSPQMLVRFRQDVLDLHPAVVVILAGTNDIAENTGPYDSQATLNNIMSMAELARAHGVRVILCSVTPSSEIPWHKGLTPAPKIVALNAQIKAYAQQQGMRYLDYHTALVDERQGIKAAFSHDGAHPSLAGYRVMEPLLNQAVAVALKSPAPHQARN